MYVHIGQDYMIPIHSIVAVFDMDTATWSKHTQKLLSRLEQECRVIVVCEDLPRSAVLCDGTLGEFLYISQFSSTAIQRRAEHIRL